MAKFSIFTMLRWRNIEPVGMSFYEDDLYFTDRAEQHHRLYRLYDFLALFKGVEEIWTTESRLGGLAVYNGKKTSGCVHVRHVFNCAQY